MGDLVPVAPSKGQCWAQRARSGLFCSHGREQPLLFPIKCSLKNSCGNIEGNLAQKMPALHCTTACVVVANAKLVF